LTKASYGDFTNVTSSLEDFFHTPFYVPRNSGHVGCWKWTNATGNTLLNMFNYDDTYSAESSTNYNLTNDQTVAFFVLPTGDLADIDSRGTVISGALSSSSYYATNDSQCPMNEKSVIWAWFNLDFANNHYDIDANNATLLAIRDLEHGSSPTNYLSLTIQKASGDDDTYLWRIWDDDDSAYINVSDTPTVVDGDMRFFAMLSWDNEISKAYAFIYSYDSGSIVASGEVSVNDVTFSKMFQAFARQEHAMTGAMVGIYVNDDDIAMQFLKNVPYMPNGYIGWNGTSNSNITIADSINIKETSYPKMLKWSNLYANGFPALNYVNSNFEIERILPAPSFLLQSYQATIILFSRNGIERFVITDDGSGGISSSLINLVPEQTNIGVYANHSLVSIGKALFWVTHNGAMMWTGEGLARISRELDVTIPDHARGFFDAKLNQYCIFYVDNGDNPYGGGDGGGTVVLFLPAVFLDMISTTQSQSNLFEPPGQQSYDAGTIAWAFDQETTAVAVPQESDVPSNSVYYTKIGKYLFTFEGEIGGETKTAENYALVRPVADFIWTPQTPMVNASVTFTCQSKSNSITSRSWSFGNSAVILSGGTGSTPVVKFTSGGDKVVSLTMLGDGINYGQMSATVSKTVTVEEEPLLPRYYGVGDSFMECNIDYVPSAVVSFNVGINGTEYYWFAYPMRHGRVSFSNNGMPVTVPYTIQLVNGYYYYVHRSYYVGFKVGNTNTISTSLQ